MPEEVMERISISLSREDRSKLKAVAKKLQRSEAWCARKAVGLLLETAAKDGKQLETVLLSREA